MRTKVTAAQLGRIAVELFGRQRLTAEQHAHLAAHYEVVSPERGQIVSTPPASLPPAAAAILDRRRGVQPRLNPAPASFKVDGPTTLQ
jgi:hypothetical protein